MLLTIMFNFKKHYNNITIVPESLQYYTIFTFIYNNFIFYSSDVQYYIYTTERRIINHFFLQRFYQYAILMILP